MGGYVAAPLGHAVDLALFHVAARLDKDMGKDVAREDRALSAYAGEKYVRDFLSIIDLTPFREESLRTCILENRVRSRDTEAC